MSTTEDPPFISSMVKITSFSEGEEILKSQAFEAGEIEDESFPFRGATVIELDGDPHFARRRLHAPLFARSALKFYETQVLDAAIDRCLGEAARGRDGDGVVRANLVTLTRRMMFSIVGALVGFDDLGAPDRVTRLHEYADRLSQAVVVKWSIHDHQAVIEQGLDAKRRLVTEFVQPAVARRSELVAAFREGRLERSSLPTDLITLMLLHWDPDWDDDLLVREVIVYISASVYSTSSSVVFAVDELDRWLSLHPEDRARVGEAEFLRHVSNETLRLRPTFPATIRRAVRETQLKSGRVVRPGERFAVMRAAVNTDPSVFGPDAGQFDPFRVVPSGVRPYGLAFGGGAKTCIGLPMVTAVSGTADEGFDRAMVRMLSALYRHGVSVERRRVPLRANTAEERYEDFPVSFSKL